MSDYTRRHAVGVGVAVGLLTVALSGPAVADGTVTATLTVAEAPETCLLLSVGQVDFDVLDFGEQGTSGVYEMASCTNEVQEVLVAGTDAVNAPGDVGWVLSSEPGVNAFAASAWGQRELAPDQFVLLFTGSLSPDATSVYSLSAHEHLEIFHRVEMPEEGSDGAGEQMTFDIVWTAVIADGD